MLPNSQGEHDYNELAKSDYQMENLLSQISDEWIKYIEYLKTKYPPKDGANFTLTCEHHRKIHELITGQKL